MRIATWNIERLKHISRQKEIEQICSDVGADILVLTEADNRVRIGSLSYFLESIDESLIDNKVHFHIKMAETYAFRQYDVWSHTRADYPFINHADKKSGYDPFNIYGVQKMAFLSCHFYWMSNVGGLIFQTSLYLC